GPVVIILALIAEGAGRGPALDDEVVRLLEPLAVLGGIDARLQGLHGCAAHKSGDDAAAGVAVEHGDLFGHADGVVDGDDIPQDGDLGLFGELGDDGGVEIHGRLHAPVGGVVLVAHDAVKTHLIGQGVLLMILIVQNVRLLRVKMGVGEAKTARLILFQVSVGDVAVGLLRKPVDFDAILWSGKRLDHTDLLRAMALPCYAVYSTYFTVCYSHRLSLTHFP